MEGDSDAAGRLSRISPPLSSVSPPITSLPQPQPNSAPTAKQRRMFTVDLRPGETTVVSWKKLIKESGSGNGEDLATMESKPALEAGPVAGVGLSHRILSFFAFMIVLMTSSPAFFFGKFSPAFLSLLFITAFLSNWLVSSGSPTTEASMVIPLCCYASDC
ncbi:hypothetical protein MA16_Dca028161 [Dendrobium catenatum]|uniref:Uncharacterized protein n=1 Tax=Dendrobium catenatum TaxID=906689 RepID=A0A2I0VEV3_9ASPA|nr:hypothetical protein MA16_Dca028161 [Dendrobium catenatum]